jgi:hypothetical protein
MITELPNALLNLLTKLIEEKENNTLVTHNERFREKSNQWNDTKKSLSHIEKTLTPTKSIPSMIRSILTLSELLNSWKKDNEILWSNNERKINELGMQVNTLLENLMKFITQQTIEERKSTLKIQNERFQVINNQNEDASRSLTSIRDSLIPIEQIPSIKDSIHILDKNIQSSNEGIITNLNMIPNTIMTLFTQVVDGNTNILRNEQNEHFQAMVASLQNMNNSQIMIENMLKTSELSKNANQAELQSHFEVTNHRIKSSQEKQNTQLETIETNTISSTNKLEKIEQLIQDNHSNLIENINFNQRELYEIHAQTSQLLEDIRSQEGAQNKHGNELTNEMEN